MLNIQSFTFNPFQENTYLITNEAKQCWIVDPGMYGADEENELIRYLTDEQLEPRGIINTHAHLDHIFGASSLMNRYNIPFSLHEKEMPVLESAEASAAMFGMSFTNPPKVSGHIKENEPLQLGHDTLRVLLTPGHSPGSISFYYPEGSWIVSGDVLFAGSIGRTDLPGGDYDTLIRSISTQLLPLPGNTVVFSGHGPATVIKDEKDNNPFLQGQ